MRTCFASHTGESGLFFQSLCHIVLRQQLPDYMKLFVLWIALLHTETSVYVVILMLCTCGEIK
jgi:hypothetical protein